MIHRRGMMLWEMMGVVILVAACMLLASRIMSQTMLAARDLPAAERSMAVTDHFLAALRRDAWGAASARTYTGGVRIELPDSRHVDWVIDDAGTIRRWADGQQQVWSELAPGLTWDVRPAVLIARWPDGTEVTCVSQVQLAGGER